MPVLLACVASAASASPCSGADDIDIGYVDPNRHLHLTWNCFTKFETDQTVAKLVNVDNNRLFRNIMKKTCHSCWKYILFLLCCVQTIIISTCRYNERQCYWDSRHCSWRKRNISLFLVVNSNAALQLKRTLGRQDVEPADNFRLLTNPERLPCGLIYAYSIHSLGSYM